MQKVLEPIQRIRFTESTLRHASIQEKKGPSLGKIQVKLQHQRSPYATKFEDMSHEETERQQRCARSKAWNLAKNIHKLKEKDKATFHFPAEEWVLPAASTKEPEEREFVVDSGASMHMVSEKDLHAAELATMRTSRSPTTVMITANGEVPTNKKRRKTSNNWTYSSLLCFFKKLPQCFHWGNSAENMDIPTTGPTVTNHVSSEMARELLDCNISNYVPFVIPGFFSHWTNGHKPRLIRNGKRINRLQYIQLCTICDSWFYQRVLPQRRPHLLLHHFFIRGFRI